TCSRTYVVVGRICVQGAKLRRVVDGSVLGLVVSTVRVQLVTKHVIDPDVAHHGSIQLRVLYQLCTHQQSAIAATGDSEMPLRGPARGDQRLRRCGEIVEDVLLRC